MKVWVLSVVGLLRYFLISQAYIFTYSMYGIYTKTNDAKKGRNVYQSDFKNGMYSIWWCGNSWQIGLTSDKGKCRGNAKTSLDVKCVSNTGHTWRYYQLETKTWHSADDGLGIRCLQGSYLMFFIITSVEWTDNS